METMEKKTRTTKQRQVILEEIKKVSSHPTADEVHALVRKKLPKISLGTIYRNLEFLAGQNQILRLDGPETSAAMMGIRPTIFTCGVSNAGK